MFRILGYSFAAIIVLAVAFFGFLAYSASLPSPLFYSGDYFLAADRMPWVWTAGGLNSAHEFGTQDGKGPLVLDLSRVGVQPGQTLVINYVDGYVVLGMSGAVAGPYGLAGTGPAAGAFGAGGLPLPGGYATPPQNARGALILAFTNGSGQLVAAPFAPGTAWIQVTVPPRAENLQLGINDDQFAHNVGHYLVAIAPGPTDGQIARKVYELQPGSCVPYNGTTICGSPDGVSSITVHAAVVQLVPYYQ